MTRSRPLLVALAACLAAAAPAAASGPAGSLTQLAGNAGCITDDGTSNALASQCADGRGLAGAEAIAVSPDGRFAYTYSYDSGAIAIMTRDPATGALSQANDTGACVGPTTIGGDCTDGRFPNKSSDSAHAIVISPDGAFLFAASSTGAMVSGFRRDTTTGALTEIAGGGGCISASGNDADASNTCTGFSVLSNTQSLAISPDGRFLYVGNDSGTIGLAIFSVSPTGELSGLPTPNGCFRPTGDATCTNSRYANDFYDIALSGTHSGSHANGMLARFQVDF